MFMMGIDPGNTTGIAMYSEDKFDSFELHALDTMPFIKGWLEGLRDAGVDPHDIHFYVERFVIGADTHKKTAQPAALELCHQIQALAALNGAWYRPYGASITKQYEDKTLRRIGAYKPTRDGHANDATRVLLCGLLMDAPTTLWRLLQEGMPKPIEVDEA